MAPYDKSDEKVINALARPLNLPKYVFLLSDRASRQLAVDVANRMQEIDNTVYIDDFFAPIHNAFMSMFDKDFSKDYGNPSQVQTLMNETIDNSDLTEEEVIASLKGWFLKTFPDETLGKMGHQRATDQQALTDYIYVFRDASQVFIAPFLKDKTLRPGRDLLSYNLIGNTKLPEEIIAEMEAL